MLCELFTLIINKMSRGKLSTQKAGIQNSEWSVVDDISCNIDTSWALSKLTFVQNLAINKYRFIHNKLPRGRAVGVLN